MPIGLLVTVPLPLPTLVTVRVRLGWKVAVTLLAASMVTVQGSVPLQPPPLQPVKMPLLAVAVSLTRVPWLYLAVQVSGAVQTVPAGSRATVPVPVPALVMVSG